MMLDFGLPQILVTLGGLLLSAFVLWYFLAPSAGSRAVEADSGGGVQELAMTVKGGYTPDTLVFRKGVPARLVVRREEEGECSEELVISELHIKRFLPPHETTTIEFTPQESGEFRMTCGMGMLHGTVIVKPA